MTVVVRRVGPDEWRDWRMLRQRSLAEDPGAFAASVAAWTGPDDTEQRWRARLAEDSCFIAYDEASPVGMVAGRASAGGAHELTSMWVAPEARRQGAGAALVAAVIDWNADAPLTLRVIDGNRAAIAAYERAGFIMPDDPADHEGCRRMISAARREVLG